MVTDWISGKTFEKNHVGLTIGVIEQMKRDLINQIKTHGLQ